MLISACEDTGLADPNAISVVNSCAEAFDRVGMPEGRYFLAHAALYLATAPKSNSSMAFFDALASVEKEDAEVPNHLRDNNRDAEGFGHGAGYLYPHAYRDHWVAQQYLPDALMGRVFYTPSTQGYEATIREDVLSRREIQIAQILEKSQSSEEYTSDELATSPEITGSINIYKKPKATEKSEFGSNPISEWWINEHFKSGESKQEENLTFSPKNMANELVFDRAERFWRQRLDSNRAEILLGIRDTMISMAQLMRHHRSLIWNADSGLLLWDVIRKTPEGVTCGVCKTEKGKQILEQYCRTLGDLDKPILQARGTSLSADFLTQKDFYNVLVNFQYKGAIFDRIFFTDPFASEPSIIALAESIKGVLTPQKYEETETGHKKAADDNEEEFVYESPLAKGFKLIISQKIPCKGQHISEIVRKQILTPESVEPFATILNKMEEAEQEFFGDRDNPLFSWDGLFIANTFRKKGFTVKIATQELTEKRKITPAEIEKWFTKETSAYASKLCSSVGNADIQKIVNLLIAACDKTLFDWKSEISFFIIEDASTPSTDEANS